MTDMHPIFAYDLLLFADGYHQKLCQVSDLLAEKKGFKAEKGWLSQAIELVENAKAQGDALKEQAHLLPELADLRADVTAERQGAWVDALERLVAGITF